MVINETCYKTGRVSTRDFTVFDREQHWAQLGTLGKTREFDEMDVGGGGEKSSF